MKKIAIFDRYLGLSRKREKMWPLQWKTNRNALCDLSHGAIHSDIE